MAVILSLLLLVTFIANYISTTLPNTMAQNDLQHDVQVQNQVARLSALVEEVAEYDAVGAQVSQPIALGSAGAPPFAVQDPSKITPLVNQSALIVNFTIKGPSTLSLSFGQPQRGVLGSGFVVHLQNTYAPAAEVAYEGGATVFAQPASIPVFTVPPGVSYATNVLSLFLPQFSGQVPSEAGAGTADVSLRLLSTQQITMPSNGYSFMGKWVTVNVTTPYWAAWDSYFTSVSTLSPYVSCVVSGSACPAQTSPLFIYSVGAPLGTVTLHIPTTGLSLNLLTALYAFALS